MTNEVKNVPKLRFQRFEDEWKKKRLKDIVEPLKGNSGENKNLPVLTISAKKGWLNQKERFSQVIAGNSLNKYNELKKGDLSYNKGNSKVALYGIVYKLGFDNALVPNVYKSFRPKPNNVSDFLEKYFHTKILDRQLRRVITSTARMDGLLNISDYDFYNMSLNIPVNNEQKKIGDFFSKLDQQIELEEQKLAKLEEQKKGYMQKIFSQELRFKDENGNDYPEWEDKLISDIGKVVTGNTPSKKDNDYWNSNQYVWVTPTDISNKKNIYTSGYQLSQKGFSKARQLPKNTLLITCIASIGKNAILRIEGSCNQQINAVIPNDNYDVDYLYYAFEDVSKLMKSIAGKTATQIVNKAVFEKLLLNVPIYEEQQKISGFLNKVDILIDKQTQKIDELKLRKQGFLQKMFV